MHLMNVALSLLIGALLSTIANEDPTGAFKRLCKVNFEQLISNHSAEDLTVLVSCWSEDKCARAFEDEDEVIAAEDI